MNQVSYGIIIRRSFLTYFRSTFTFFVGNEIVPMGFSQKKKKNDWSRVLECNAINLSSILTIFILNLLQSFF
jgi:hypothetical protein